MNKSPHTEFFRNKGLLPFQAEFAVNFLADDRKPYWQLASPVGTGKTRLAGAIIAHELEVAERKRFLVLCPASLLFQWQSQISEMISSVNRDVTPMVIDRRTYLELESRVPVGKNPWPTTIIALMSIDLAKRDDMARNLGVVTWDLVIIDESHLLTGKRRIVFQHLTKSGAMARALLLTATPSHKLEGVATKSVSWNDVVDWNGNALYPSYRKTVMIIDFERSKEEKNLLRNLTKLTEELTDLKPYGKFQSSILLRAAASSTYALEESLRRLQASWRIMRNKIVHGIPWTKEDLEKSQNEIISGLDDVESLEDIPYSPAVQRKKFLELYKKLETLLDSLEEIETDSKLDSLLSYLRTFLAGKDTPYFCIWTSFRNTAEYLMSSLEDLNIAVYVLTGSFSENERRMRLDLFRNGGGILISTDAMHEGVALQFVDEALNYDLPVSPIKLEQRWSRFLRVGRKSEFRMGFMRDRSGALIWEKDLLNKLERSMSSEESQYKNDME